ncbi:MAG: ribonuclease HII, partial [Ignisphaera sp.]
VGAASIVAKILRDNYIAILKRIYGEIGSGYPSDYRTIQWVERYLRKYGEIPPIVRKSWRTVRRMLSQL